MTVHIPGQVRMTFKQGLFYAKTSFEHRLIAKNAGFYWNEDLRLWYTREYVNAARLRHYADARAKEELDRLLIQVRPWEGRIPYPEKLSPYPFQIERAVPWALERNRAYLALDPGLGKTICAALYLNALEVKAIYVCPPFLMGNVEAEMRKWLTGKKEIVRYGVDITPQEISKARVLLLPDSILHSPKHPRRNQSAASLKRFGSSQKRWDDLRCTIADFKDQNPDSALIVDEAHRFKNINAGRTTALFKTIVPRFERVVFMSGTPMPNRPLELWPVLSNCAPETIDFKRFHDFGVYYCKAFEGEYGWDYTGASNTKELAEKIKKTFMLRIRKDEVLTELPPKTESIVLLDEKLPPKLLNLDRIYLQDLKEELEENEIPNDTHLSTYRQEIGVAKALLVSKYVREILTDSGESILLFAIHKEAIEKLAVSLRDFKPLLITGSVDKDERFKRVRDFQEKGNLHRLMILNIQAGGVGFNLTKAARVVFGEYSWVPGENDQAADRAHRIGQKDNVLVNYLVYPDSLEAAVLATVLSKRRITEHV